MNTLRVKVYSGLILCFAIGWFVYHQQMATSQLFQDSLVNADGVEIFEGLPHQHSNPTALKKERATKSTRKFNGHYFYNQPLDVSLEDRDGVIKLLSQSDTYETFEGEKKCGGFHPDFAVTWNVGPIRYRALLCFGCGEVKLFGSGIEQRYDLSMNAKDGLEELLNKNHKHLPQGLREERAVPTNARLPPREKVD